MSFFTNLISGGGKKLNLSQLTYELQNKNQIVQENYPKMLGIISSDQSVKRMDFKTDDIPVRSKRFASELQAFNTEKNQLLSELNQLNNKSTDQAIVKLDEVIKSTIDVIKGGEKDIKPLKMWFNGIAAITEIAQFDLRQLKMSKKDQGFGVYEIIVKAVDELSDIAESISNEAIQTLLDGGELEIISQQRKK